MLAPDFFIENISAFYHFYTVCMCGTFNAASEKLILSRQAVSASVRKLESAIGCPLLTRSNKGVVLTEAGRYLYERCQHIFRYSMDTLNHLESYHNEYVTEIVVDYCTFSENVKLLSVLFDYESKQPSVSMTYHFFKSSDECFDDVNRETVDFAFAVSPDENQFECVTVETSAVGFYTLRSSGPAEIKQPDWRILDGKTLAFIGGANHFQTLIMNSLEAKGVRDVSVRHLPPHIPAIGKSVDDTIVFAHPVSIENALVGTRMTRLVFPDEIKSKLCFIRKKNRPLTKQKEIFFQSMKKRFETEI